MLGFIGTQKRHLLILGLHNLIILSKLKHFLELLAWKLVLNFAFEIAHLQESHLSVLEKNHFNSRIMSSATHQQTPYI